MAVRKTVHRALAIVVVFLFSFAFQTESLADMTITKEITTTVGGKKTASPQIIYFGKSKMRTDDPSGLITITDLDAKAMIVLNPKEKTYTQESFDDVKKLEAGLPREVKEAKLSVQEAGEKQTIDGYPCEKLILGVGPSRIEVWITTKIAVDPAVVEFDEKFLKLTRDVKTLNLQGRMRAAFEDRKAYPYLTVIEMPLAFAKGTQRTESKVKKVSYEKIDPSVFTVPSEYRKVAVPSLRQKRALPQKPPEK